jgi:hypothetical protein
MRSRALLAGFGLFTLACGSPVPAPPAPVPVGRPPTLVRGLCDASAAVAWRGWRVVADDETNALRFVRPDAEIPAHAVDLSALVPGLADDEADFEGMALVGDTLWLIGSHDSGTKREPKAARGVFLGLALDEVDGAPTVAVRTDWRDLRAALDADPRWTSILGVSDGRTSKEVLGFSVEGLASDPDGRFTGGRPGLLIGLRAPVIDGRALVIPLVPGDPPTLGDPVQLELGGEGVRSLERTDGGWMGVAGAPTAGGSFRLFRWPDGGPPVFRDAPPGFAPEAIWAEGGTWWALSDDGNEDLNGKKCKKAAEVDRRARLFELQLP